MFEDQGVDQLGAGGSTEEVWVPAAGSVGVHHEAVGPLPLLVHWPEIGEVDLLAVELGDDQILVRPGVVGHPARQGVREDEPDHGEDREDGE